MADEYPKKVPLKGGGTAVLRPMVVGDEDAVANFYKSLAHDDMLFLREDLSRPEIVKRWAADAGDVSVTSILAEIDGQIVGQASLHRNRPAWSSHVAEIQVVVAPSARRSGLGTLLTEEVFVNAVQSGIEKILAEMTPDQTGARSVFEHLGFRAEGLLTGYVQDRDGNRRDILIMAHDVDAFLRRMAAFGVVEEADR